MSYPMSLCSTENLQEEAFLQHGAQGEEEQNLNRRTWATEHYLF